jgi:hypothetical protein
MITAEKLKKMRRSEALVKLAQLERPELHGLASTLSVEKIANRQRLIELIISTTHPRKGAAGQQPGQLVVQQESF